MITFKQYLEEMKNDPCWTGYKMVGKKKKNGKEVPNCVPEAVNPAQQAAIAIAKKKSGKYDKDGNRIKEDLEEATYQGKKVTLNKPMAGDVKKSKVYVDPDGDGKAQKVNFGDKKLSIKKNIPARKRSYCARSSGQGNLNDKTSANYWSRRAWEC